MSHLKLYFFGPPRVEFDETFVEINRRKALALLVYLAVDGQPHSRDALATLFYADYSQSRARAYLRRDLALLNTTLAGEWLVSDRETIELKRGPELWLDVAHFRQNLAACQHHGHPPEATCSACVPLLTEAVELYTDDFLAGFTLRDAPEFDDWQFFQAESLRQTLATALERLVQSYSQQGQAETAIPHARRWVGLDTLHEPSQRALIQLYDQAGQQAAALRQYEEYVALLETELGIPPEEETTTLYEAIKAKRLLGSFIKTDQQKRQTVKSAESATSPPASPKRDPTEKSLTSSDQGQVSRSHKSIVAETMAVLRSAPETRDLSTSIIVLPFVNLSADPDNEYFCDGLAEDIINALSKIKALRVVGRATAFSFKGKNVSISDIGRELKVQAVLEGSVRQAGDRLRINLQLSNTADDYHIWSERYDRRMDDIFAVQDEISLTIAEKLKLELFGPEKQAVVKRYTDNIEAYHLYLKGRYFEFTRKGIDFFHQAIDKDPTYALAYAGLADSYTGIGMLAYLPPEKSFVLAKVAAEKALAIDDSLAEAHCALGLYKFWLDHDWAEGARELERAIALDPNYAPARQWYANLLVWWGQVDEALAEIKRAQDLDPLSPVTQAMTGFVHYCARNFDEAIRYGQVALEIDPNNLVARYLIAMPYKELGQFDEAIATVKQALALSKQHTFFLGLLGHIYGVSGQPEKARQILAELQVREKERYVTPLVYAWIYLGLADYESAITWFEKAFEAGYSPSHIFVGDSVYDGVRTDPRFKRILRRLGLERWTGESAPD